MIRALAHMAAELAVVVLAVCAAFEAYAIFLEGVQP